MHRYVCTINHTMYKWHLTYEATCAFRLSMSTLLTLLLKIQINQTDVLKSRLTWHFVKTFIRRPLEYMTDTVALYIFSSLYSFSYKWMVECACIDVKLKASSAAVITQPKDFPALLSLCGDFVIPTVENKRGWDKSYGEHSRGVGGELEGDFVVSNWKFDGAHTFTWSLY